MNIFTVSFFGHRKVSKPLEIEDKLEKIIGQLIKSKEYVEFLVGREGDFDIIVTSVVRRTIKKYNYGNSSLILILPYEKAEYRNNKESFLDFYDEVEICRDSADAYFKAAIQIRNCYMVDRSDLVVCNIERKSGGAYKTVFYAEKIGKEVLNLF